MNSISPFIIIILLMVAMLVFSGRKQKRLAAEARQRQTELEVGDVVYTTTGLRATVTDVSYEETVDLEIAPGITTTWLRRAVGNKVDPTPEADEFQNSDDAVGSSNGKVTEDGQSAADTEPRLEGDTKSKVDSEAETDVPATDRGTN